MNQSTTTLNILILLFGIILLAILLSDCYQHAQRRKIFWMVIIVLFGLLGWLFFYFSKDRQ